MNTILTENHQAIDWQDLTEEEKTEVRSKFSEYSVNGAINKTHKIIFLQKKPVEAIVFRDRKTVVAKSAERKIFGIINNNLL